MGIYPAGGSSSSVTTGPAASDDLESGNPVQIGISVDETSRATAGEGDVRRLVGTPEGQLSVVIEGDGGTGRVRVRNNPPNGGSLTTFTGLEGLVLPIAQAPDTGLDRLKTLGDTDGTGKGVLAAAPWIPGASDVKTKRGNPTSTTRVTLVTPTSGKKIRIIAAYVVANSATAVFIELYFGTGAGIGTDDTKLIYELHADRAAGNSDNANIVFPDGGGPVGAVDEVVSMRLTVTSNVLTGIFYREE